MLPVEPYVYRCCNKILLCFAGVRFNIWAKTRIEPALVLCTCTLVQEVHVQTDVEMCEGSNLSRRLLERFP
jgi:hypothetical protein